MKIFNPIDFICIVILFISKIFKNSKRLGFIYEKVSSYVESRYVQTNIENDAEKKE